MDYVILFSIAMWAGFVAGVDHGKTQAQRTMHRGEVKCQTMPDQKIVCWKVTDTK